jgi:hypothetical protein
MQIFCHPFGGHGLLLELRLRSAGCADKLAEKRCWLICCEKKTLFWLKKQAEKYRL